MTSLEKAIAGAVTAAALIAGGAIGYNSNAKDEPIIPTSPTSIQDINISGWGIPKDWKTNY